MLKSVLVWGTAAGIVHFVLLGILYGSPLIVPGEGLVGSMLLGAILAAIRIYPRFWNMWIQTRYPRPLLAVEVVNGTIGTLAVASFLHLASP